MSDNIFNLDDYRIKPAKAVVVYFSDEVEDAVQTLEMIRSCLIRLEKKDWEVLLEAGRKFRCYDITELTRKIIEKSEGAQ